MRGQNSVEIIIDFIFLALIYVVLYRKKLRKMEKPDLIKFTVFYLYIAMVLYVTIMPFELSITINTESLAQYIHTTPFEDFRLNRPGALRECLLNVVMTMPFGFLLPWVKKKSNVIGIGLATLLFSACIEMIQLYYCLQGAFHSRSCDVTDLITNTIGGMIGYLIYCLAKNLERQVGGMKCSK
jgi:glycopeptide antibiotics resistance protein